MRRTIVLVLAAMGCAAPQRAVVQEPPKPAEPPAVAAAAMAAKETALPYPPTRRQAIEDTVFGHKVADPYRWLEDVKSDEVRAWMSAQDRVARDWLAKLPGRPALEKRLHELFYVDSISAPRHRGGRFFYTRTHADREKAIVYWREGDQGEEHVLLDPNTMTQDGTVSLGVWVPSRDGKRVAYTLKANNADEATLHVMEVQTGKVSQVDVIEGAKYAQPSWTPQGDGFYYTWLPPVGGEVTVDARPAFAEVRFHKLGRPPSQDERIHEKTGDPTQFIAADLSRDGHWLVLYVNHGWSSTDVWFRDTRKQKSGWTELAVGTPAQYEVEAWKDVLYVRTNDGAPRWRLMRVDPKKPARAAWREIVAEQKEAVLDGAGVIGGHLALSWLQAASSRLEVRALDGSGARPVQLPGIGTAFGPIGNPDEDTAYFGFVSFTQPMVIWKTSVQRGTTEKWAEVKLPIDPTPFTVEQVWYPSSGGARVSMFLVHRKDLPRDGSTPFLLGGYGGFNISMTPQFSGGLFPWLEAGGGYALPNLRGGGEYGEEWHKAGMGAHKQNVFDDYLAAAEYLIAEKYTSPAKLAIRGGSNGGLLVGAAMTQKPELFRAVVCQVPLLDMMRYHLFGSGRTWISEYGTAEKEDEAKTLLAYSPYHHVARAPYPSVLMMSADADDRVDPMHARKMAAALQAETTSGRPVILRIERHAGHGGADMVKQAVEQGVDAYSFLMHELGMTPKGAQVSSK